MTQQIFALAWRLLLLDENLSLRAVRFLQDAFPGSTQIALFGMENSDDRTIWLYAKVNDFMIVTKDADFFEMASIFSWECPPGEFTVYFNLAALSPTSMVWLLWAAPFSLHPA